MHIWLGWAWIPLLTGFIFLGGIIALLAAWAAEGHPQYQPDEGSIVYISDVGAHLQPLFISMPLPQMDNLMCSNLLNQRTWLCAEPSDRSVFTSQGPTCAE
jgi:Frag1/DRAM/Sfk1 family